MNSKRVSAIHILICETTFRLTNSLGEAIALRVEERRKRPLDDPSPSIPGDRFKNRRSEDNNSRPLQPNHSGIQAGTYVVVPILAQPR